MGFFKQFINFTKMKKAIIFLVGILLLLFLFSVKPIFAADKYQDGVIGGDEIIPDDILLNATDIEVSGKINGILLRLFLIMFDLCTDELEILEVSKWILITKRT